MSYLLGFCLLDNDKAGACGKERKGAGHCRATAAGCSTRYAVSLAVCGAGACSLAYDMILLLPRCMMQEKEHLDGMLLQMEEGGGAEKMTQHFPVLMGVCQNKLAFPVAPTARLMAHNPSADAQFLLPLNERPRAVIIDVYYARVIPHVLPGPTC